MYEVSSAYGYLLLILGLIIAIYTQLKLIFSHSNKPIRNITQTKWNQLTLLAFLSLTIMGTLILFIDVLFKEAINYRFVQTGLLAYSVDIFVILNISVNFWLIMTRVRMQTTGDRAGQYVIPLERKYEFGFLLLFLDRPYPNSNYLYLYTYVYFMGYLILGGSVLIMLLSLIPIYLTKRIFETALAW